jgi:hypothetical protein
VIRTALLLALGCFSSVLTFAGMWTGTLVDSRCYAAEERNVNPTDTQPFVDRDRNLELRMCTPNAKTKSFAVVQPDNSRLGLDPRGNSIAAELVRKAGRKPAFYVTVTGEMGRHEVKVKSIVATR